MVHWSNPRVQLAPWHLVVLTFPVSEPCLLLADLALPAFFVEISTKPGLSPFFLSSSFGLNSLTSFDRCQKGLARIVWQLAFVH